MQPSSTAYAISSLGLVIWADGRARRPERKRIATMTSNATTIANTAIATGTYQAARWSYVPRVSLARANSACRYPAGGVVTLDDRRRTLGLRHGRAGK